MHIETQALPTAGVGGPYGRIQFCIEDEVMTDGRAATHIHDWMGCPRETGQQPEFNDAWAAVPVPIS